MNEGNVAGCNGTKDESWRDWEPIGDGYHGYKGTFDGQEHTISGLYFYGECNPDEDQFDGEDVGVVRKLDNPGIIQNIGLENSYFYGETEVAGICGRNSGGTIRNCYNTANITGTSIIVGGIVGYNYGTVSNCYNTGNIEGGSNVGGVCGFNEVYSNFITKTYGTIEKCYNTGNVTGTQNLGGICGTNSANAIIKNCYNAGDVTGTTMCIGGIIGKNAKCVVENCYNTGTVTGTDEVGAVCGMDAYDVLTNCYYLAKSETDKLDGTTFKTADQFASGEVAYLLNGKDTGQRKHFPPEPGQRRAGG